MCEAPIILIEEIERCRRYPRAEILHNLADTLDLEPYQLFVDKLKRKNFTDINCLYK
jgi:hypothetical protein